GRYVECGGGLFDGDGVAVGIGWRCGRDAGALTDPFDAGRGERQPGSGAPALPVQDRCDLMVGVVHGEAADQLDRVLLGPESLAATSDQTDRERAASAALPEGLDLGDVLR